ncbi:hypothetical protein [Rhizobium miluonense]|uniref:Uncharacterized protein n=1 Tax=Rhizobium miluonense TaxID=411945 RepID=A0A1C3UCT0_9HYPH|nr:hypothetical protein [Rhizobium miluonense]SCB13326.1 hypothetical protein GA0061102_10036 [Rhizobium miluonense]
MKHIVFLRVLSFLAIFAMSWTSASADQLADEFRASKLSIYGTDFGYLDRESVNAMKSKQLMVSIGGKWVMLDQIDVNQDKIEKACKENAIIFTVLDEYSFSRCWSKEEISDVYVNKAGSFYSIRGAYKARIDGRIAALDATGKSVPSRIKEQAVSSILRYADRESVMVPYSPNVLLEISMSDGFPLLYGRCSK